MRRTAAIGADRGAVLLTDYVSMYPNGLTLINTSDTVTLYLGEDSLVTPTDGVPLPPGMSAPWSSSEALYACVRDDGADGQVLLTDNIAPLTGQIPPSPTPDVWTFKTSGVYGGTFTGASTTPHLAGPATAEVLFTIDMTGSDGDPATVEIGLISNVNGQFVSLASTADRSIWKSIIDGVPIYYGGYTIAVRNNGSARFQINAGSQVTLVRQV